MKQTIAILAILLVFVAAPGLTACGNQKAAENLIVPGKNTDRITENANKSKLPGEDKKTIKERVNAPALFKYENTKDKLTIAANASVFVPEGISMPVIQIQRGNFSQEQIDSIWNLLVGDTDMYEIQSQATKEQYRAFIADFKKKMQSPDYNGSYQLITEDGYVTQREDDERRLKEYEKENQNAPESIELIRANSKLKEVKDCDPKTGQVFMTRLVASGRSKDGRIDFGAETQMRTMPEFEDQYSVLYASDDTFITSSPPNEDSKFIIILMRHTVCTGKQAVLR